MKVGSMAVHMSNPQITVVGTRYLGARLPRRVAGRAAAPDEVGARPDTAHTARCTLLISRWDPGPKDNGSLFEATIGVCFGPNRTRHSGC